MRKPRQRLRMVSKLQDLHLPRMMLETVEVGTPLSKASLYADQSRLFISWITRAETAWIVFIEYLLLCEKSINILTIRKTGLFPKIGSRATTVQYAVRKK